MLLRQYNRIIKPPLGPRLRLDPTNPLTRGLKLFLALNESASIIPGVGGPATVYDASGNEYNGSITYSNGNCWRAGDRSIIFHSSGPTNDKISCGTSITTSVFKSVSALTMSMRSRQTAVGQTGMIGCQDSNAVQVNMGHFHDGVFYFTPTANNYGSLAGLNDTAWRTSTMVYDGSLSGNSNRLKGWINRTLQTLTYTGTIPATTDPVTTAFLVGPYPPSSTNTNGEFEYVAVWNRALSAAEVTLFESAPYAVLTSQTPRVFFLSPSAFTHTVTLSDSVTFTDSLVPSATKVLTLSDSISLLDSLTTGETKNLVLADTISFTDNLLKAASKNLGDTITFTDLIAMTKTIGVNLSDTLSFVDSISMTPAFLKLIAPSPAQGLVQGGTPFTLIGNTLDESGVALDFDEPTLDPAKVTNTSTGSGRVTVIPATPRGSLQLDTGSTPNSRASIKTVGAQSYTDVSITAVMPGAIPVTTNSQTAVIRHRLALINPVTSDYARLTLELSSDGKQNYVGDLRFNQVIGGQSQVNLVVASFAVPPGAPFQLRFVYALGRTIAILGGTVVFDSPTGIGNNVIEVSTLNDITLTSRSVLTITRYLRSPVVTFGTEPALQLTTVNKNRVDGFTPPVPRDEVVDVTAAAWAGTVTLRSAWKYFFDPNLTNVRIGIPGQISDVTPGRLTAISDPTVKGTQPNQV